MPPNTMSTTSTSDSFTKIRQHPSAAWHSSRAESPESSRNALRKTARRGVARPLGAAISYKRYARKAVFFLQKGAAKVTLRCTLSGIRESLKQRKRFSTVAVATNCGGRSKNRRPTGLKRKAWTELPGHGINPRNPTVKTLLNDNVLTKTVNKKPDAEFPFESIGVQQRRPTIEDATETRGVAACEVRCSERRRECVCTTQL